MALRYPLIRYHEEYPLREYLIGYLRTTSTTSSYPIPRGVLRDTRGVLRDTIDTTILLLHLCTEFYLFYICIAPEGVPNIVPEDSLYVRKSNFKSSETSPSS